MPTTNLFTCSAAISTAPTTAGCGCPSGSGTAPRLGLAYELHLLPLLDGSTDPAFLNSVQVEQLVREFRFVGELVDDPVVESHVHALIALSGERSDGASKDMIGIEFP